MSNSEHRRIGEAFQHRVLAYFQRKYGSRFELEKSIKIGSPPKGHRFDISDEAGQIVIECKRYTWTETGNVPSGKIRALNEAAFFLSLLPAGTERYIVMYKASHPRRHETLAAYYFQKYHHLLGGIRIAQYDPSTDELHIMNG